MEDYLEEDIEIIKKNRIKTIESWKKLTEEQKDKDGYPRGLRIILDEISLKIQSDNEILQELDKCQIGTMDLKPSEKLWNIELQKNLFGPFYKEGVKVPFRQDQNKMIPTPIYNGLFESYKGKMKFFSKYELILGTSGTSKTFAVQQEAQKTFMIYVLCNDPSTLVSFSEIDYSFTTLYRSLRSLSKTSEDERIKLIDIYFISRIYFLKLALEEAERIGIELDPVEFFIMQYNGNSKTTSELFDKVRNQIEKYNNSDKIARELLRDILSKYPYVKKKGISFAIDEAGAANQLLSGKFTSPNEKSRALLTGIIIGLKNLEEMFLHCFFLGTHMSLSDKDSIISAIGKEENITNHFTKEATIQDHLEILGYFYNLDHVNFKNLQNYLLTGKKRLSANVIRFLDIDSSKEKTQILKNALEKSYETTKQQLKNKIEKYIKKEHVAVQERFKRSLEELAFVSFFYDTDKFYPLSTKSDINIDLMNLGLVSQEQDGDIRIKLTKDPLVIEVCYEIHKPDSLILQYIMKYFKLSLLFHGIKSTKKGIDLELIILSVLLEKNFQDKSLSQLSFIQNNLPTNYPKWIDEIIFKCNHFGTKETFKKSDIEILKNEKNVILKPENQMHPDGIMVFEKNGKYYFLIICDKMSFDKVKNHKKNILSGDIDLFYVDKYVKRKENPRVNDWRNNLQTNELKSIDNNKKRRDFFNQFPPSKIGGVIRILFELDSNEKTQDECNIFKEEIQGYEVEQIIIHITMNNFNTFLPKDNSIYQYFNNLMNFAKKQKTKY